MASISIPAEKRQIDDPREIASYVAKSGLSYERWDVAGRIAPGADSATVLEAYAPEIERLKKSGGYVTADVIDIKADTLGYFMTIQFKSGWRTSVLPIPDGKTPEETPGIKG